MTDSLLTSLSRQNQFNGLKHRKLNGMVRLAASIGVMAIGGWLALDGYSPTSLAFGSATLAAVIALLWMSINGWEFPAAVNWPWLTISALLGGLLLPLATVLAITGLSIGWALVAVTALAISRQLGAQLLLFRSTVAMVAWNLLIAAPASALLFGQSLGHETSLASDPLALAGIAIAAVGLVLFWYQLWNANRRLTAR
ncbi:hypothetical protein [Oceanobacter mangrovi]|uniref:hypothetical protein n=1 Tax=Oceanobacter mangrovi TaxID=2862510 RepID=UPI001C8DA0E5|nr:hypothetical protein [Oceanobacter mangrovi]